MAMNEDVSQLEPYLVLFVGTSNSKRCVKAQSMLNHARDGRVKAYLASTLPDCEIHPLALAELNTMQIPLSSAGSRNWNELADSGAPELDFVFALCDEVAGEACPV